MVLPYIKIFNEFGRIDNFLALASKIFLTYDNQGEKIIISPNFVRYFWYTTTLCTYSVYLSTSHLLSFIISKTDRHEFSGIWKWISCSNDVMNHVDCVIKRDV